jgi:glycosyltransferase involved in cell wall biosynthesis
MKILHIIERFNPFLGQEINFIAKNKSTDFELTILTSTSLRPWNITNLDDAILEDDYYRKQFNVEVIRNKPLFEYGEKLWMRGLFSTINTYEPEIIYVHGIEYISFFRIIFHYLLQRRKTYRLFTDTHSLPVFAKGGIFRTLFYGFLKKIIIQFVNQHRIIAFSTAEENEYLLKEIYGVDPLLIKPFCIGADLKTFRYDKNERVKQRRNLEIGEKDILIIFTGRLCIQKSPHLLIDSISLIPENYQRKIYLLFIGFQDEEYMKNEFNKRRNKSSNILIKEAVKSQDLCSYYSASDFAVFPLESTLSSLECQACKLPVIMEANETNSKRIKYGGLTYKSGDIKDLSDKILMLAQDDSIRNTLSEDGYNYVCENYDYLKNLRQMEGVLRNKI